MSTPSKNSQTVQLPAIQLPPLQFPLFPGLGQLPVLPVPITVPVIDANVTPPLFQKVDDAGRKQVNTSIGDSLTIERIPDVALRWPYNINTIENSTSSQGSGTVTTNNDLLTCQTGATVGSLARLTSIPLIRYRPGAEVFCEFTTIFTCSGAAGSQVGIPGSVQAVGLFDSSDGFAIGFNGQQFGIRWRFGGNDTWIPQTEFNVNQLPSIDLTQIQLWRISYAWFGGAPIFFEILNENGNWILFHIIHIANHQSNVSVHNPSFPATIEAISLSSTTNVIVQVGCIEGGSARPIDLKGVGYRNFSVSLPLPTTNNLSTTYIPLISVKNPTTFQGKPNKTVIRVELITITATTTGNIANFKAILNATLTGANFQAVDAVNSVAQYDTAATAYSDGTSARFSASVAVGSTPYYLDQFSIYVYPGQILTIIAAGTGAATGTVDLDWEEQY